MRSSSMGYVEQRNSYDEDILKKISNGQKGLIIDIRPGAMIKELKSKKKGLETDYSYPLFRKGKHFEFNSRTNVIVHCRMRSFRMFKKNTPHYQIVIQFMNHS